MGDKVIDYINSNAVPELGKEVAQKIDTLFINQPSFLTEGTSLFNSLQEAITLYYGYGSVVEELSYRKSLAKRFLEEAKSSAFEDASSLSTNGEREHRATVLTADTAKSLETHKFYYARAQARLDALKEFINAVKKALQIRADESSVEMNRYRAEEGKEIRI